MAFPDFETPFTGEQTQAAIDADTTVRVAKLDDFTATLSYKVKNRIGIKADGTELFILRARTVDAKDLFREAQRYSEHIRAGRAYVATA